MASGDIPDSSITASSFAKHWSYNRKPEYARLGGTRFWTCETKDPDPWIQVDLISSHTVTGLQTEGNDEGGAYKYWVEQIKVKVGVTKKNLMFIEDASGQPRVS